MNSIKNSATVKRYILFIGLIVLVQFITAQVSEFEKLLFNLPVVRFEKIPAPPDYESAYRLYVKQPLDHFNPEKGSFYQKVYLTNKTIYNIVGK